MARKLVVQIVGDSRSLERAFDRSAKSAKGFQAQVTTVGKSMRGAFAGFAAGIGATLGFAAVVDGLKTTVKAASDLQESMSKTTAVFDDSSAAVVEWSKTTSAAFGVSQRAALETASSFGALFAPLGIIGPEAAEQSQRLTELGADLASFYNTDVQSALDAIRSGLVGESEPLRRYGALLSETRVVEEALVQTHKRNAAELTAQEKVLARISLIYRDTAGAQGDFARTSDGLAAQQKILNAQIDDLQAKLGAVLIPHITTVARRMNRWLANTENTDKVLQDFSTTVETTAAIIGDLAEAVDRLAEAYRDLKGPVDKANESLGKLPGSPSLRDIGTAIIEQQYPGLRNVGEAWDALATKVDKATREITGDVNTMNDAFDRMAGTPDRWRVLTDHVDRLAFAIERAKAAAATPRIDLPTQLAGSLFVGGVPPTAAQGRAMALARTGGTGTAAEVAAIQAELAADNKAIAFAEKQIRLGRGNLRKFADELVRLYGERQSALNTLAGIRTANAQDAARLKADADERVRLGIERQFGWLDFGIEQAEATGKTGKLLRALRKRETFIEELIKREGRTFELATQLWRTRQRMRELNKRNADVDPLAGLMQVSTAKLTNILAAGTGLGLGGRRTLGRNIAGAQLQPMYIGVNIDGREVGRAVTRDQRRTGHRTSKQTSGFRG